MKRLKMLQMLCACAMATWAVSEQTVFADDTNAPLVTLPGLYVTASHTAIVEPASTFGAPVSRLELNPQIDLQVRNLAEAQGDVTIRGGIFENTGFRVGAASLLDPQTGHYAAEIPIAPEMLEGLKVETGVANALGGFNSTVGSIRYGWSPVKEGGAVSIGLGDNGLNYERLIQSMTFDGAGDGAWGVQFEASRSESAGTVENGDHNFMRYSGRVQYATDGAQTDVFVGYQSKYIAWPELYAAPYGSNESDSVRTLLLMANHVRSYGEGSQVEATVYHRVNHDHYLYNRFVDNLTYLHETEATAAAIAGNQRISDRIGILYTAQLTTDSIESTRLENSFTDRDYVKLSIAPEVVLLERGEESVVARLGVSYDDTNRDSSEFSPMADIVWNRGDDCYYLSFAQTSQVAGYTAVGGSTSGLFASNPNLDREVSQNLEAGVTLQRGEWSLRTAVFLRDDQDLVDWTFSYDRSSARSANNVDIETYGFEVIGSRRIQNLELLGSYTFLDKDEDYGSQAFDASYYALNYAEHRATLAAVWSVSDMLQVRMDNEYRQQRDNVLREGGDSAFFTHIGVSYRVSAVDGLELNAAVENLWEEDFQEIPGTPGRGRQTSVGARWSW